MSSQGFPAVPEMLTDAKDDSKAAQEHRRKMALAINTLLRGKSNCTFDVAVTTGATSTIIEDPRIGVFTAIVPGMAFDAVGAADIAAGIYFDTISNGTATMHHRNNGSARTLRLVLLG